MTNRDAGSDDNPIPERRALPERSDGRPAELAELVGLLREVDALVARAIRAAGGVDGRRAASEEGLPVDLALRLHTGWTRPDASMLLTAADLLPRLPSVAALFEDGVLSWGHVRQVVCGVRRFDADQLATVDAHLSEQRNRLTRLDAEQRSWAIQDLLDDLTSKATLASREDRDEAGDRLVLFPRLDGSGGGTFDLHPEAFQTVASRLQAEADAPGATPAPVDAGSAQPPPEPAALPRTKQLADALVRLCSRRSSDGGPLAPVRGVVELDVSQLTDRFAGRLRSDLATKPPRIVRRAIDRLTCDADLDLVLRQGTDLLAAKRYQPSVPEATRRAVAARDGGCRFPGCRAPISWCDVHHVVEQARHRDHHLSNLVLLCRRHHVVVHRRGWRQHLAPDGRYRLTRHGRTWSTLPRRDQQLPPPDPAPPTRRPTAARAARDGPASTLERFRRRPDRPHPGGGENPPARQPDHDDGPLPF